MLVAVQYHYNKNSLKRRLTMYIYASILGSISVATLAVQFLAYYNYKNRIDFSTAFEIPSDNEICQN